MYLAWLEDDIENEYVATHVMSDVNQYWIGEFISICYMKIYFISSQDQGKYCRILRRSKATHLSVILTNTYARMMK